MPPKKNSTPVKPPEGSTMIHKESENMSFRVPQLEKKLEESMERNMGNLEKKMEKKLEEGMDIIVNLIQHT